MTVLLLHAFPLDARMWEATRAALEEAGHEVTAPDLPPGDCHATFAAWAERLLAALEGRFIPVGISMGGYLAFELWRRARERIPGLVLVDTRATADTPAAKEARNETIRVLGEAGFDAFWDGLAPKLFAPSAPASVVEQARALAAGQPLPRLVAAVEALRDREDSSPTLATIDVPVLVVVGKEDALTPPSDAEAMAAALADARLVRLPAAGHLTPLERAPEFNAALVDFLQEMDT